MYHMGVCPDCGSDAEGNVDGWGRFEAVCPYDGQEFGYYVDWGDYYDD